MAKKDDKSNSEKKEKRRFDPELLKKGLRCDLDQYERLKRCSKAGNIKEWNEWREEKDEDILLEGAELGRHCLRGAFLHKGGVLDDKGTFVVLRGNVYMKGANMPFARLERAMLLGSHLESANAICVRLEGAELYGAHLEGAHCNRAHLENTKLGRAHLEGTDFSMATVNGSTELWECEVSHYRKDGHYTDFTGVGLDNVQIDPGTKQLLEYNIRRMNWEDWYKEHWFWRWPVQLFWAMSDYGRSTLRVIGVFFLLAFLFAAVYVNCAYWRPPGIVSNLSVEPHEPIWHYGLLLVVRPVYFSIVTMTTLGFGDMYANKGSIAGHVILAVQVILGYVLLGALITRFAVLFTAGGPAGKFEGQKKKVDSVSSTE